jgi:hypothetical protein
MHPVTIDNVEVETGGDGTRYVTVSARGAEPRDLWLALHFPGGWSGTNTFVPYRGSFTAHLQLPSTLRPPEPIPVTVVDNDSGTTAVAAGPDVARSIYGPPGRASHTSTRH